MTNVVRIATSNSNPVKRACGTCKHVVRPQSILPDCSATGRHIMTERHGGHVCGPEGKLWEPVPHPIPILIRFKRWLIG